MTCDNCFRNADWNLDRSPLQMTLLSWAYRCRYRHGSLMLYCFLIASLDWKTSHKHLVQQSFSDSSLRSDSYWFLTFRALVDDLWAFLIVGWCCWCSGLTVFPCRFPVEHRSASRGRQTRRSGWRLQVYQAPWAKHSIADLWNLSCSGFGFCSGQCYCSTFSHSLSEGDLRPSSCAPEFFLRCHCPLSHLARYHRSYRGDRAPSMLAQAALTWVSSQPCCLSVLRGGTRHPLQFPQISPSHSQGWPICCRLSTTGFGSWNFDFGHLPFHYRYSYIYPWTLTFRTAASVA